MMNEQDKLNNQFIKGLGTSVVLGIFLGVLTGTGHWLQGLIGLGCGLVLMLIWKTKLN